MSYSRKMAAGSFMEPARGQWPGMVGPGAATPGAAAGGGINAAALVRAGSRKRVGRAPEDSRAAAENATAAAPGRASGLPTGGRARRAGLLDNAPIHGGCED